MEKLDIKTNQNSAEILIEELDKTKAALEEDFSPLNTFELTTLFSNISFQSINLI